jgi:hypothetical protein
MLKELVKLANHLDSIGHKDISNDLDSIIKKIAQDFGASFDAGDIGYKSEYEKALEAVTAKAQSKLDGWTDDDSSGLISASAAGRAGMVSPPIVDSRVVSLRDSDPMGNQAWYEELKQLVNDAKILKLKEQKEKYELGKKQDPSPAGQDLLGKSDAKSEAAKSETVMRVQELIGSSPTGLWADVRDGQDLFKFLTENAPNIVYPAGRPESQEQYPRIMLREGPAGFAARGADAVAGKGHSDWLKIVQDLVDLDNRTFGEEPEQMMWAKTGPGKAERVPVQLDNEASDRIESMAKALDKLFKY